MGPESLDYGVMSDARRMLDTRDERDKAQEGNSDDGSEDYDARDAVFSQPSEFRENSRLWLQDSNDIIRK